MKTTKARKRKGAAAVAWTDLLGLLFGVKPIQPSGEQTVGTLNTQKLHHSLAICASLLALLSVLAFKSLEHVQTLGKHV